MTAVASGKTVPRFFQEAEFIRDHVFPLVARRGESLPSWDARISQLLGTGRVTLDYRLGGETRVFAKYYPDGESGLASYRILRALWEHGFGPEYPCRVPEPLGYLTEHHVLLMGAAPGESVLALQGRDLDMWKEGVGGAARWLAALHASPVRIGPPEDVRRSLLRLARHLAQAAARQPEAEDLLVSLVRELAKRAALVPPPRPEVQTHGRYHSGHVFLAPASMTAIDLDRSGPGDPAMDVGEFLHFLRSTVRKGSLTMDLAEQATTIFLQEYTRSGSVDLSGLVYYWSNIALRTLVRLMRKAQVDRETGSRHVEFHRAEFYDIPRTLEVLAR